MPDRLTKRQMLELAARGVGRIDAKGRRGLEQITYGEIEAMALALVGFGLISIAPGATAPAELTLRNTQGEIT